MMLMMWLCVSNLLYKCIFTLLLLLLLPGQVSLVKQVLISRWGSKMNLNPTVLTLSGENSCYSLITFLVQHVSYLSFRGNVFSCHEGDNYFHSFAYVSTVIMFPESLTKLKKK